MINGHHPDPRPPVCMYCGDIAEIEPDGQISREWYIKHYQRRRHREWLKWWNRFEYYILRKR